MVAGSSVSCCLITIAFKFEGCQDNLADEYPLTHFAVLVNIFSAQTETLCGCAPFLPACPFQKDPPLPPTKKNLRFFFQNTQGNN